MIQTVTHNRHSIVNILVPLLMALAAVTCLAEGQLQLLKSTYKKLKSLKFWYGAWRSTASKRVGQNFEPL